MSVLFKSLMDYLKIQSQEKNKAQTEREREKKKVLDIFGSNTAELAGMEAASLKSTHTNLKTNYKCDSLTKSMSILMLQGLGCSDK